MNSWRYVLNGVEMAWGAGALPAGADIAHVRFLNQFAHAYAERSNVADNVELELDDAETGETRTIRGPFQSSSQALEFEVGDDVQSAAKWNTIITAINRVAVMFKGVTAADQVPAMAAGDEIGPAFFTALRTLLQKCVVTRKELAAFNPDGAFAAIGQSLSGGVRASYGTPGVEGFSPPANMARNYEDAYNATVAAAVVGGTVTNLGYSGIGGQMIHIAAYDTAWYGHAWSGSWLGARMPYAVWNGVDHVGGRWRRDAQVVGERPNSTSAFTAGEADVLAGDYGGPLELLPRPEPSLQNYTGQDFLGGDGTTYTGNIGVYSNDKSDAGLWIDSVRQWFEFTWAFRYS